MARNLFCLLISFLVAINVATAQNFTPVSLSIANFQNIEESAIEWGDFNNDGRMDFIQTGKNSNLSPSFQLKLFLQNSIGGFDDRSSLLQGVSGVTLGCIALTDYDNDGRLDIFLAGSAGISTADGYFRLLRQKSDGSGFENKSMLFPDLPVMYQAAAEWGDYDNDGRVDILISGAATGIGTFVRLYHQKNDGSGFENKTTIIDNTVNVARGAVRWADFNGDGLLDFFVMGRMNDGPIISRLFRQKSDGSGFEDVSSLVPNLPNLVSGDISWQDYDNDGLLDFVIMGTTNAAVSGETVRLYRQKSDRSGFEDKSLIITGNVGIYGGKVRWCDFNNDGRSDFLINGFSSYNGTGGIVRLYQQQADGTGFDNVAATISGLIRVSDGSNAWCDYNNDGKPDFALSGKNYISSYPYWVPATRLYQSTVTTSNNPPHAPHGLNVMVNLTKRQAIFEWQKPADDTSPDSALTYSIFLREVESDRLIIGAAIDLTTGFRRTVKSGDIRRTRYIFAQIDPNKTYQWSIQAIDNSFAGSPLAPTQVFDTYPLPSEIETVKDGTWTDPQIWSSGIVPTNAQRVTVQHIVTLPSQAYGRVSAINYKNKGRIIFQNDSRLLIGEQ